jgi:hypothetical protein
VPGGVLRGSTWLVTLIAASCTPPHAPLATSRTRRCYWTSCCGLMQDGTPAPSKNQQADHPGHTLKPKLTQSSAVSGGSDAAEMTRLLRSKCGWYLLRLRSHTTGTRFVAARIRTLAWNHSNRVSKPVLFQRGWACSSSQNCSQNATSAEDGRELTAGMQAVGSHPSFSLCFGCPGPGPYTRARGLSASANHLRAAAG